MRHTYTQTYSILPVSRRTYQDIKNRLIKSGTLFDYLDVGFDEGYERLNFGTVAFESEPPTRLKREWVRETLVAFSILALGFLVVTAVILLRHLW